MNQRYVLPEMAQLVAEQLSRGYAVEFDNRFSFFPLDLFPSGLRSRIREEITILGHRVDEAWQTAPGTATPPIPCARPDNDLDLAVGDRDPEAPSPAIPAGPRHWPDDHSVPHFKRHALRRPIETTIA
jgi:hypothetical protein